MNVRIESAQGSRVSRRPDRKASSAKAHHGGSAESRSSRSRHSDGAISIDSRSASRRPRRPRRSRSSVGVVRQNPLELQSMPKRRNWAASRRSWTPSTRIDAATRKSSGRHRQCPRLAAGQRRAGVEIVEGVGPLGRRGRRGGGSVPRWCEQPKSKAKWAEAQMGLQARLMSQRCASSRGRSRSRKLFIFINQLREKTASCSAIPNDHRRRAPKVLCIGPPGHSRIR